MFDDCGPECLVRNVVGSVAIRATLRDLLAGETENWTFVVWGSWNKPICVLGSYKFQTCIAYRRRLL